MQEIILSKEPFLEELLDIILTFKPIISNYATPFGNNANKLSKLPYYANYGTRARNT